MMNREIEINAFAKKHSLTFNEAKEILFTLGVQHLAKDVSKPTQEETFFSLGVVHQAPQVHIHLSQNNRLTKRTIITEEYERA